MSVLFIFPEGHGRPSFACLHADPIQDVHEAVLGSWDAYLLQILLLFTKPSQQLWYWMDYEAINKIKIIFWTFFTDRICKFSISRENPLIRNKSFLNQSVSKFQGKHSLIHVYSMYYGIVLGHLLYSMLHTPISANDYGMKSEIFLYISLN